MVRRRVFLSRAVPVCSFLLCFSLVHSKTFFALPLYNQSRSRAQVLVNFSFLQLLSESEFHVNISIITFHYCSFAFNFIWFILSVIHISVNLHLRHFSFTQFSSPFSMERRKVVQFFGEINSISDWRNGNEFAARWSAWNYKRINCIEIFIDERWKKREREEKKKRNGSKEWIYGR